jgi:phosphoglycerate kinase
MSLPTIERLDVTSKVVLVRSDLNVPLEDGRIGDDFRIVAALPTIHELRRRGARVVVASHLGRPSGADPSLSMAPVSLALASLGDLTVALAEDVAGESALGLSRDGGPIGGPEDPVVLIENTRFEAGETKNDPDLAKRLSALADCFVMDAFGSAHRAHASTVGVAERLPSAAGPLMLAEVEAFERLLHDPAAPFVVVLGGAKVSSKIGVIEKLVERVDRLLVGGAMCFTLLAARGEPTGAGMIEEGMIDRVRGLLDAHGDRIVLPTDLVVGESLAADTPHRVARVADLAASDLGLDIGPETTAEFADAIAGAATLFWNGPVGVAEWEPFAGGSRGVADAIAAGEAYSVVGGGDTVAYLRSTGMDQVSHLSTGGGAGLELIEHGSLPGIDVLRGEP